MGFITEIGATVAMVTPVALAAVALIGYLVGQHQRRRRANRTLELASKLDQAHAMIAHVESVSHELRRTMASHHSTVSHCHDQIEKLSERQFGDTDLVHRKQLQEILEPTRRLSKDIAHAYDELRQQTRTLTSLHDH